MPRPHTQLGIALVLVALPALARADSLEGEVGLGVGMTALGGHHPTGGFTLVPSGSIAWRFAEWGSLRYRNALPIFNLSALRWIGVINMNTALLGIHVSPLLVELGPSLDVFAVPLCASTGCQREHGVAPAGHFGAVLLPDPTSKLAAGVTVHITYIPGIIWSGVSASTALEGRYRW
ncbi:MAG: hypothetical protein ACMG6S_17300 [Byssovorax sp.]